MNKILILVRKELRDVMTIQSLIPLVLMVVMFSVIGQVSSGLTKPQEITETETSEDGTTSTVSYHDVILLVDNDQSDISKGLSQTISKNGIKLLTPDSAKPDEALTEYESYTSDNGKKLPVQVLMEIPAGFGDAITRQENSADLNIYSRVSSFSLMSNITGTSVSMIVDVVSKSMSDSLLEQNITSGANLNFIKNPIVSTQFTFLNGVIEKISSNEVIGFVTMQTIFIPIIVFMIVMYATQLLATSISTEKTDKTLETLLTTPVSRANILTAKMLSASIMSLIYSAVYMFGFNSYMKGMTGGEAAAANPALSAALANMGISFNAVTYLLVGLQLFLSILIGLAFALIIGALAEDMKNMQSLMMPLMMMIMVPYLLSVFVDVNTLPLYGKLPIFAIPFSHTFNAITNIFTGHYAELVGGMIYQLIFLIVVVRIAVWIFSTDRLFTLKLKSNGKRGLLKKKA